MHPNISQFDPSRTRLSLRRARTNSLDFLLRNVSARATLSRHADRNGSLGLNFATLLIVMLAFMGCPSYAAAQTTTTAAVALSPANPTYGDETTVTVTLAGSGGTAPTGTVSYTVDGGTAQTATVTASGTGAVAYLDVPPQVPGAHSLSISYSGDGNYTAITGQSQSFSVTDLPMALVSTTYANIPYVYAEFQGNTYNPFGGTGVAVDRLGDAFVAFGKTGSGVTPSIAEITVGGNYVPLPVSGLGNDVQLATDATGNLYIADPANARVLEYSTAAALTNLPLPGLMQPGSITYDAATASLFIADTGLGAIIKFNLSTQAQTTVFNGIASLNPAIATDGLGGVYYVTNDDSLFYRAASGVTTPIFGEFAYSSFDAIGGYLQSLAFDPATGRLWIGISALTSQNTGLMVLDKFHHATLVSYGDRTPVTQVALDSTGKAYTVGDVTTLGSAANSGPGFNAPFVDSNFPAIAIITLPQAYIGRVGARGDINTESLTTNSSLPTEVGGNSWPYTVNLGPGLSLTFPVYGYGVSQELVADPGTVTALPLTFTQAGGMAYISPYYGFGDTIYLSDKTTNTVSSVVYGVNGDGTANLFGPGPTLAFTGLVQPTQVAADGASDVWVMDQGAASGGTRIVELGNNGMQTVPYSAATGDPASLISTVTAFTVDGATNLILGGSNGSGGVIVKIDTLGNETLVASGIAVPAALAVDGQENIFSVDASTGTLIKVDHLGALSTIATGLPQATQISLDPADTVYLSSATATSVLTIASDGTQNSITVPGVANPGLVVVDDTGSVHIADGTTKAVYLDYRQISNTVFGSIPVNTTVTKSFAITNIGTLAAPPFSESDQLPPATTYRPFTFTPGATNGCQVSGSGTLASGQSCQVQITYSPTMVQSDSDLFYLDSNLALAGSSGGSLSASQVFPVSGAGTNAVPAPIPALTPPALDFGSLAVGTTSTAQAATLSNTGNAALTITSFGLIGANANAFAETNTCGSSLAAGSSCSISVTCTPSAAGALSAILTANYPSPLAQQMVTLTCNGVAAGGPTATLTPAALSFTAVVGSTPAPQVATLTNSGTAALAISGVSIGGATAGAYSQTNTCGTSLAAGASCAITVSFSGTGVGSYPAALQVADNAPNTPQAVTLSGTVTTATAPGAPIATLTPTSLTYSATTGTTSAVQVATLTNSGTAALNISGITLTGVNTSEFAISANTCGATLAINANCTVSVTFSPDSVASFTAAISVADDAAGSPQSSTLTGTGSAAAVADFTVAATPATQSVTAGSAATYTIPVASTGGSFTDAVALTATGLPPGATVSFSPASVIPGTAGGQSTMTVQTAAQQTASSQPSSRWPLTAPAFAALLLLIPGWRARKHWNAKVTRAFFTGAGCLLVLLGMMASITGCGAGFALPGSTASGTTYTITVTGTSGTTQHNTTVQITVR
jgi:Bacterial Ig-like domain (group 3)/Abnormal spindle-like microcephaly-assoc'd, ASPM-SPD-2-Hydin